MFHCRNKSQIAQSLSNIKEKAHDDDDLTKTHQKKEQKEKQTAGSHPTGTILQSYSTVMLYLGPKNVARHIKEVLKNV